MMEEAKGQAVLFAATVSKFWPILAATGQAAIPEAREMGNLEDCGFRSADLPTQPGLYVWEGSIWVEPGGWCGSEPVDADIDWTGEIRPARLADLRRFGMQGVQFTFPPLPERPASGA